MTNWDAIMKEARRLANLLQRAEIDLNEAEKALGYYLFKDCNDQAMERYLHEMGTNPPPRSRRTQNYYRELHRIWKQWSANCSLSGLNKARAWGWGIKMTKGVRA